MVLSPQLLSNMIQTAWILRRRGLIKLHPLQHLGHRIAVRGHRLATSSLVRCSCRSILPRHTLRKAVVPEQIFLHPRDLCVPLLIQGAHDGCNVLICKRRGRRHRTTMPMAMPVTMTMTVTVTLSKGFTRQRSRKSLNRASSFG